MRITNKAKPTVFYDGGCPLCKKEISHYMGLDTDCSIVWIDITEQDFVLKSYGSFFAAGDGRITRRY